MAKNILPHLKNNLFLLAFLVCGVAAFLTRPATEKVRDVITETESPSADTYIPRGHVLVPLEISNAESLTSLVGNVGGVVDLYLSSTETQKGGLKVGSRLKLLRAPLNPQQYAVLVRDEDSVRLLQHAGPFTAVVQNPEVQGSHLTQSKSPRVQINYQN